MKVAISTEGKDLTANVDSRFGRAKGFLVYDTDSKDYVYVDNKQNLEAAQGAGIQTAKTVIDAGAEAVITGNVGPKAFSTLKSAGIKIYLHKEGNIEKTLEQLEKGELETTSDANVDGHW